MKRWRFIPSGVVLAITRGAPEAPSDDYGAGIFSRLYSEGGGTGSGGSTVSGTGDGHGPPYSTSTPTGVGEWWEANCRVRIKEA